MLSFDNDTPVSLRYGDSYFSRVDGVAESRYVYLQQGGVLERFATGREHCVVGELGLGTGLNFLLTWQAFEESGVKGHLDYISIEKYPLSPVQIRESLAPWREQFGAVRLETLCAALPPRDAGKHIRYVTPNVTLTLIYDDVLEALPQVSLPVDCWYLDGFAPAKNPAMWSENVLRLVSQTSAKGARFSTFTAAGFVRRGLQAAGFTVEKVKGFGRKREMLRGRLEAGGKARKPLPRAVTIVGAGLAGSAACYALKRRGVDVRFVEPQPRDKSFASAAPILHLNPRLGKSRSPRSDFHLTAYDLTLSVLKDAPSFEARGLVHCHRDPERAARLQAVAARDDISNDTAAWKSAAELSDITGLSIPAAGLYLPRGARINPQELCKFYRGDTTIEFQPDFSLETCKTPILLANSLGALAFLPDLPLKPVRGQMSVIKPQAPYSDLKTLLHFDGAMLSPVNDDGLMCLGSTFKPFDERAGILEEDTLYNLEKLNGFFDLALTPEDAVHNWMAFRCTTPQHSPIIGKLKDCVYGSLGHGSHGGIGSLLAGEMLVGSFMTEGDYDGRSR